jgi:pimeloyl-ACP methyl ester carboxylesterase
VPLALSAAVLALIAVSPSVCAQDNIRPIPPPGVAVPDADRAALSADVEALGREIDALRSELKGKPGLLRYLPDVQIYYNAVRYPLLYNEFYNVNQIATAKDLLAQGRARAKSLRDGDAPWTKQPGLLALGYVSKIDGSVQPYALVVPETFSPTEKKPKRLDFFCHGRGETLTELAFISERQRSGGEFMPPDTFVLHPYGRYCNANRFAGEVDLFEALADARTRYPIDGDRLVMRGFSMGGASAWQYATHFPDLWAAAAPGAGFSEATGFLRLDAPDKPPVPWYEQKLFHWYDATDYAANLYNCPTIAYNGDKDGQKQAADRMETAMAKEGLTLTRVIGKDTGHRYSPEAKKEIDERVAMFAAKGRDTMPRTIQFTTWTLRYNKSGWVTVTGLGEHWERARVNGELAGNTVQLTTENVTRLELAPALQGKSVVIDGQSVGGLTFAKENGRWKSAGRENSREVRKKPGLQGPIDDAFMDRFVMVRPTGTPLTPRTGAWTNSELPRAIREWRATFRGDAIVRDDKEVTDADIKGSNLVLWGDPSSNEILARIASRLPIKWEKDGSLRANGKTYPVGTAVPVLIYPNPLNPSRYVVINSGITWREEAYLNNAQQRSRLPDWAVIDITTPPDKTKPGRIADAGFFDENWRFRD